MAPQVEQTLARREVKEVTFHKDTKTENITMEKETTTISKASNTSSNKRKRTDGLTYVGPKDDGFAQFILEAVRVFFNEFAEYFGPQSIAKDDVDDDPSLDSEVHLRVDRSRADRISRQIRQVHLRKYDEATLTIVFTKYLAPFDDYIPYNEDEAILSLFREKWKPQVEGPVVPTADGCTYDWAIEPDRTYLVSLNLLPED